MDPLTHTLVGASLASTRLKAATRLAVPALVIGANLPDVDVLSYVRGSDFALGFRRGWTHGVPALIVLPALLALALWLWSRRWPPERRKEVDWRWLAALSYLAVLTHPALDWLNTYGMRWWMPLSDTWYYGDAVFIMDPWLWLVLGGFWLAARRPTLRLGVAFGALATVPLLLVGVRAPRFLPVVLAVVAVLALCLLLRIPSRRSAGLPAVGLALGALYVGGLIVLQGVTEGRVRSALPRVVGEPAQLMVGPIPIDPLRWDVVAGFGDHYRHGRWDWRRRVLEHAPERLRAARTSPTWEYLAGSGQIPGFRRWSRFPWIESDSPGSDAPIYVMDARYARRRTTGFGGAVAEPAP